MTPRTLYEKLWQSRSVRRIDDQHVLLYADLHIMNEYTSPQAFSGLRAAGRTVRNPAANLGIIDHVNSTGAAGAGTDAAAELLIRTFAANCAEHGIVLFDLFDPRQGIEHIVVPEQGMALPGMTILCGDSHTTTYGAFGALGFGIGTSDVEHVLATQTVVYRTLRPMLVRIDGQTGPGVSAKDLILGVISRIGAAGANGHAIEFAGSAVTALDMAGRMTICNMAVEAGARAAVIAPDAVTLDYLAGRPHAPTGALWDAAVRGWTVLHSDPGASFDDEIDIDAADIAPLVTWGTSPDQVVPISGCVPDPSIDSDADRRRGGERALAYMALTPGTPMEAIPIDRVFIGSCTNSRIEDLRAVAEIVAGRRVAPGVTALVVPGSWEVRRAAEAEGIAAILTDAGFEWRTPGCSMCLAMNDDVAAPGERCASSTNRNFEGRQGRDARTHLMSPAMAAAAAVTGRLTDVRRLERKLL